MCRISKSEAVDFADFFNDKFFKEKIHSQFAGPELKRI